MIKLFLTSLILCLSTSVFAQQLSPQGCEFYGAVGASGRMEVLGTENAKPGDTVKVMDEMGIEGDTRKVMDSALSKGKLSTKTPEEVFQELVEQCYSVQGVLDALVDKRVKNGV